MDRLPTRKWIDTFANHAARVRAPHGPLRGEPPSRSSSTCATRWRTSSTRRSACSRAVPRKCREGRERERRGGSAAEVERLHGLVHQPRRSTSTRSARRWTPRGEGQALPREPDAGRAVVPARARPARALGARRAGGDPRGGLLLLAAGADQGHERGLGQLLALADHDRATLRRERDHRLRGPQRGCSRRPPASSTPTSSASSSIATSKSAGTRASSARSGKTATTWKRARLGPPPGLGRKKIFEVRALYNDVTFIDEFLTPDFVHRAEAVHLWVVEPQRPLRDRHARVQGSQEKLLFSSRTSASPSSSSRRQPREPRRAPAQARAPGRRPRPRPPKATRRRPSAELSFRVPWRRAPQHPPSLR
jgi:hypothetical protein